MIKLFWQRIIRPIDGWLLLFAVLLVGYSLFVLFSASNRNLGQVIDKLVFLGVALLSMWLIASIPQQFLMRLALPAYLVGVLLLIAVALFGEVSHGARRWLDIGVRIQPSELMKLALPLTLAWYFHHYEATLRWYHFGVATAIILLPFGLILKQPDLGTAMMIGASGFFVLYLAGMSWRILFLMALAGSALVYAVMDWDICIKLLPHEYQCQRIATMLDPKEDPLGAGYHIIQGTIAIGSGGWFGRGWLNGTQTHLDFIPERTTDFIFAVLGEEFGLLGNILLLVLYLFLIWRGLYLASRASTTFGRLLGGAVTLTFFTYAFVNMGMVSGILPVVGVPLPLISYGGTSLVSLFAGFGLMMGIRGDRKLMKG